MKKKRLISLIAAFSLVFTGVTAYVPSGVYAEENVQMENLVQGKAAIASSTANGYGPEYAVDGVTSETVQWNSADMKNWELHQGTARILKNRLLSGFRSTGEKMQRKKIFRQLSFGIM